ncbi:MAG: carboxylesterase family protein [Pseudomonadaceae bacterium]|nr:carboxylesterase family protein [Pseudomonadaceae bacterium]
MLNPATGRVSGLSLGVVLLLCACGDNKSDSGQALTPQEPAPIAITTEVPTTSGKVRGVVDDEGLKQYHGIPYAVPPVGDLRWAPPVAASTWDGVRDASQAGPACMQPVGQGGSFYGRSDVSMSEDCLFLNVWTRASSTDANLPVMVWVHGGGLVTGSGDTYPGDTITQKGVVLVTINYRLGRFGFHAHADLSDEHPKGVSGNQGLRDQILALEWVRDNIAQFGGDPDNVTIFGESAGSLSISLLQASPLANGLFHRVIGQSGGAFQPMRFRDRETSYASSAYSLGASFANALAGAGADTSLANLRKLSEKHVLETFQSNPEFSNYDSLAIVDGDVIPAEVSQIFAEGKQADVPVMIGSNADEGSTFLPFFEPIFGEGADGFRAYAQATLPEVADDVDTFYPPASARDAWVDLFSDVLFTHPMRVWARSMANVESDAYLYWFTWAPPIPEQEKYGAFHAAEIGYVFGVPEMFGATPTEEDHKFSDLMTTVWTQFAKTGNPNGPGLPEWPVYSENTEGYMELGEDTGSKAELRIEQTDLIERAWAQRRDREIAIGE